MSSCDLAPDYTDLRSPDLSLCAVYICDFLAEIEATDVKCWLLGGGYVGCLLRGLGIFDTLNLDNTKFFQLQDSRVMSPAVLLPCAGVRVPLAALIT